MEKRLNIKKLILLAAIFVLVLVCLYSVFRIVEMKLRKPEPVMPMDQSRVIERDGVSYYPRQDMVTILIAGIDEEGPVKSSGTYNNPGEADMVALVIMDQKTEKIDVLALNRDTMLDVPVLGVGGKDAGTIRGQLALAHTYGSGLADSAENLKKTVSDFLYGVQIDYYMTMNMDAIALLNDAVGGVTVTVEEDFSEVDSTIGKGEVKLNGKQAVSFLRSRQGLGDELNLSRMERQQRYIKSFVAALRSALQANSNLAATIYSEMTPYMVTDVSSNALMGLVKFYSDYEMGDIHTVKGENVVGRYMEYHVDEAALDKQILSLLYAPKN